MMLKEINKQGREYNKISHQNYNSNNLASILANRYYLT
jgi:hypothetical protein